MIILKNQAGSRRRVLGSRVIPEEFSLFPVCGLRISPTHTQPSLQRQRPLFNVTQLFYTHNNSQFIQLFSFPAMTLKSN